MEINREAFDELIRVLASTRPGEGFDMMSYGGRNEFGAHHCIVGWMCQIYARDLNAEYAGALPLGDVRRYFGIDGRTWNYLSHGVNGRIRMSKIEPRHAIHAVRRAIAGHQGAAIWEGVENAARYELPQGSVGEILGHGCVPISPRDINEMIRAWVQQRLRRMGEE